MSLDRESRGKGSTPNEWCPARRSFHDLYGTAFDLGFRHRHLTKDSLQRPPPDYTLVPDPGTLPYPPTSCRGPFPTRGP